MPLTIKVHERLNDDGRMVDGEEYGKYYFSAYLYGTKNGQPHMATQVLTDYWADTLEEIQPFLESEKNKLCKEYGFEPTSQLIADWHFGKFHSPSTTPEDSYYDKSGKITV